MAFIPPNYRNPQVRVYYKTDDPIKAQAYRGRSSFVEAPEAFYANLLSVEIKELRRAGNPALLKMVLNDEYHLFVDNLNFHSGNQFIIQMGYDGDLGDEGQFTIRRIMQDDTKTARELGQQSSKKGKKGKSGQGVAAEAVTSTFEPGQPKIVLMGVRTGMLGRSVSAFGQVQPGLGEASATYPQDAPISRVWQNTSIYDAIMDLVASVGQQFVTSTYVQEPIVATSAAGRGGRKKWKLVETVAKDKVTTEKRAFICVPRLPLLMALDYLGSQIGYVVHVDVNHLKDGTTGDTVGKPFSLWFKPHNRLLNTNKQDSVTYDFYYGTDPIRSNVASLKIEEELHTQSTTASAHHQGSRKHHKAKAASTNATATLHSNGAAFAQTVKNSGSIFNNPAQLTRTLKANNNNNEKGTGARAARSPSNNAAGAGRYASASQAAAMLNIKVKIKTLGIPNFHVMSSQMRIWGSPVAYSPPKTTYQVESITKLIDSNGFFFEIEGLAMQGDPVPSKAAYTRGTGGGGAGGGGPRPVNTATAKPSHTGRTIQTVATRGRMRSNIIITLPRNQ